MDFDGTINAVGIGGGVEVPRRRRGRPVGSKNRSKSPIVIADGGSSETPRRGRGRPAGSKNKPKPTPICIIDPSDSDSLNDGSTPRRTSKRLAGMEADPPASVKKERSEVEVVDEAKKEIPIPAPELYDVAGFDFAYKILTDAIPLPDYLKDFPPQ